MHAVGAALELAWETNIHRGRGHDVLSGDTSLFGFSTDELRDIEVTGRVGVSEHSTTRFRELTTTATPANAVVTDDIALESDSGLGFSIDDGPVTVIGNFACADTESSLGAEPGSVTINGINGCDGFN